MKRIRIYLHKKTDADLMALKYHPTFSITKATRQAMEMVATGEFHYIALPEDLDTLNVNDFPKKDNFEISFADNDEVYRFFAENKGRRNERYVGLRSDFIKNLLRGVLTGPVLALFQDMDYNPNPMLNSEEKEVVFCMRNERDAKKARKNKKSTKPSYGTHPKPKKLGSRPENNKPKPKPQQEAKKSDNENLNDAKLETISQTRQKAPKADYQESSPTPVPEPDKKLKSSEEPFEEGVEVTEEAANPSDLYDFFDALDEE